MRAIIAHYLVLACFWLSFPASAAEVDWHVVSDRATLKDSMIQAGPDKKWFAIAFVADWVLDVASFNAALTSVDASEFPEFSFFLVDISTSTKEKTIIEDAFRILSAPTVILVNRESIEVPGTRLLGGGVKSPQQVKAWLRTAAESSASTTSLADSDDAGKNIAGAITTANSTQEHILLNLKIQPGFYLYANRLSLSIGGFQVGRDLLKRNRTPTRVNDVFFGNSEIYEDGLQIEVLKSDLKGIQCPGRATLLLKYQTNSRDNVLYPQSKVYLNVDC